MAGQGMIRFNNPSTIGQKSSDKMNYSDVRGKYLWDEDWHGAIMTLKAGNLVKVQKAKLNLYSNSIQYISNDLTELEAQPGLIKKVVFLSDKDSVISIGTFENIFDRSSKTGESYYQVLNEGKIQLLKKITISLVKKAYDPSLGRAEHSFTSTTNYFIRNGGELNVLKKLNKDSVFELLLPDVESENWVTNKNIKLKNEAEIIDFINYLNQKGK